MEQDGAAGGEISLSIEETNKLRISLGLKPLRVDTQPNQAEKERQNHEARKREEAEAQAAELRRKIEAAREKRIMESKLRAVKTLGEAGEDEDGDMASWVEKNRRLEQQRREEAARKASIGPPSKRRQRDSDDEDEGYRATELEGLKVRHDLTEVGEGETVIVTLADKPLLDEKGNLREDEDELENTLLAEEKRRRKALKAAKKEAKPLWEEDGKVRTLLDKYDEEEEEVVVQLGAGGRLETDRLRRQEEVRKKLAEGNAILDNAQPGKGAGAGGDYFTPAEMAAFTKPKKKKPKSERRIRAKSAEPEDGADILATLEAQAEEAGASGAGDLGRKADRGAAAARAEAAARAAAEEKRARFDAALDKANWASQFLRPQQKGKGGSAAGPTAMAAGVGVAVGDDDDEADRELRESLERARRLAQKKKEEEEAARVKTEEDGDEAGGEGAAARGGGAVSSVEEVARLAAARREQEGKIKGIGTLFADVGVIKVEPATAGGEVLTETMEFVRNITAAPATAAPSTKVTTAGGATPANGPAAPEAGRPGAYADGEGSDIDDDGDARMGGDAGDGGPSARGLARSEEPAGPRTGTWIAAEDMDVDDAKEAGGSRRREREASEGPGGSRERTPLELADVGITGERPVGRGLAGALGLLNDKGALKEQVEWSGRNNDKSKNALQGLDDVFTGGRHQDRVARSVESALTVRDKYGRVLTPKERFRQICYSFHGIKPSKNKIDKQMQRDAEEIAIKKAATTEDPSKELDRLRTVQRVTGSAYVVLSGKNAGLPAVLPGPTGADGRVDSDDEGEGAERRRKSVKGGMPPPGGPVHPTAGVARSGGVGNLTPLLGDRKVEAMLGIRKPPKAPGAKH
ncbi:hypothetical protein Vretimale_2974 [Volvox reticuliferus]|uniref:SART-1 protein n=1 Tax=Volvox reticuliferus TaxID=1737510 RepID=A0A8J4FK41_9CHLO|nr:hypothetical protein Vretifemale_6918 [Volvox reticuliferus]GIL97247.1 hypothetical protein Vretimale_2974 [Volvox reticuliferus]